MFRLIFYTCLIGVAFAYILPGKLDNRIINGEDTTIEEYPYQVSFRYDDEHNCGGSIIDESTILTAAHCTDGFDAARMSIRAGSTIEGKGGQLIKVAKIIQHKGYDPYSYDNDIALLKLVSPLVFGSGVSPIQLQEQGVEVSVGTTAVITGWGDTVDGGEVYPEVLQKVNVNVISDAKCSHDYQNDAVITKNMLCCEAPGKDSCQGDSGGPLVANGKQIGVVSWGIGCAKPNYPGVYSKVSTLRSWIEQNK